MIVQPSSSARDLILSAQPGIVPDTALVQAGDRVEGHRAVGLGCSQVIRCCMGGREAGHVPKVQLSSDGPEIHGLLFGSKV